MKKQVSKFMGKKHFLLGKIGGKKVWLVEPSWDCGLYWDCGYLSEFSRNWLPEKCLDTSSHTHVDTRLNTHTTLFKGFDDCTFSESQGWELSDLFCSMYTLKETAAVLRRGGSNRCKVTFPDLKRPEVVNEINHVLLPIIFSKIEAILSPDTSVID